MLTLLQQAGLPSSSKNVWSELGAVFFFFVLFFQICEVGGLVMKH